MNPISPGFFDQPKEYIGLPEPTLDSNFPNPFDDFLGKKKVPGNELPPLLQAPDSIEQALQDFKQQAPSFQTRTAPVLFDWDKSGADRYVHSDYYKELGFDLYGDNETKYGTRQTFWNVMGKAFAGSGTLAWNTFIDGWKGWGRLVDSLFSLDATKLMGSPEEMAELHKEQQEIFNKYAIYRTPGSEDSIFNRQFLGNLIQQGGFAVGAIGQFISEELVTMGMGAFLKPVTGIRTLNQLIKAGITTSELNKDLVKAGAVYKEMGFMRQMYESMKAGGRTIAEHLPGGGRNLINDFRTAKQLGATGTELAGITFNGLRRTFAEANMAFAESRMEAAGTYGELKEKLTDQVLHDKGEVNPSDVARIETLAQKAAWNNFMVNAGVISLMNRLQFDNLFSTFGSSKRILREMADHGEHAFKVTGKAAQDISDEAGNIIAKKGEKFTKAYEKGTFPTLGNINKISHDFGTRTVAWEATKNTARNMFKWEVTEGLQEMIQEGSNVAIQDYYTDLYNGNPASFSKSYDKGVQSQINFQGWKTFLMGAVTGRLMSPLNIGIEKGVQWITTSKDDRNTIKISRKEALDTINAFFGNPSRYAPEWVANTKVQNRAAQKMEEAIANRDKYMFENAKDSAFAKAIMSAKKLKMLDALTETIRDYGKSFDEKQFREAFGVDFTDENRKSVQQYMNRISDEVEGFSRRFDKLKEKFSDLIQPERYEGKDRETAEMVKLALDNTIEMMATSEFHAGRAAKRALEVMNKAATIPGFEKSSHQIFRTLGDDLAIDAEIALLESEIKIEKQATPSQDITVRINRKEKELAALKTFKEKKDFFSDKDDENKQAVDEMMSALSTYTISKNQEMGVNTSLNASDRDDFFFALNDFRRLKRDERERLDLLSFVANKKYISVFSRHLEGLKKLKENAIAELKAVVDKIEPQAGSKNPTTPPANGNAQTTGVQPPTTSTTNPPASPPSSTQGKPVSEEIVEFTPEQSYMNPDHGIKPVTYRIKVHKDTAGNILRIEYFNKDAAKPTVQTENAFTNLDEFKKYLSLLTQLAYFNRLGNGGLKQHITKNQTTADGSKTKSLSIQQVIPAVITKDGADQLFIPLNADILDELTSEQSFEPSDPDEQQENYQAMSEAIKVHLVAPLQNQRQTLLQTALQNKRTTNPKFSMDGKHPLKVFTIGHKTEIDLDPILRTVPKQELIKKLQIRVSRNTDGVQKEIVKKGQVRYLSNPSPLNLEVLYDGKVAGYLSHPDSIIIESNGTQKKLRELTEAEYAEFFESKATYPELKAAYNSSLALVGTLETLLGNNKSITLGGEALLNCAFIDVSHGQYDFRQDTRPLQELVIAGNEVIAIVDKLLKDQPLVLSQSLTGTQQKVDEAVRLMKDNDFDELTKNQGRYIAMVRLPNGIVRFVEVVSNSFTADQLDSLFVQIKDQVEKTVRENVHTDEKNKRSAVDTSFNNIFNDNILNGNFFLAFPKEYKGIYTSFEITATGELQITVFDKNNTKQDRHYLYINNLATDKGTVKLKGFKDLLGQVNLAITNYNTTNRTTLPNIKPEYFKRSIPKNANYTDLLNQVTNVGPTVVKDNKMYVFASQKAITPILTPADMVIKKPDQGATVKKAGLLGKLDPNKLREGETIVPDEEDKLVKQQGTAAELTALKEKEAQEKASLRKKFEDSSGIIKDTAGYTRELKTITEKYNRLKSALVSTGSNKKIALKASIGYNQQDVQDLQTFRDWVTKNLPAFITVVELDNLTAKLAGNKVILGRFLILSKTVDKGKTQIFGQIESRSENTFKYHEAFHAVFNLLLSDQQIDHLLRIARYEVNKELQKEARTFEQALKTFQGLHPSYENLQGRELEERFLEEWLGDRFDSWKKQQTSLQPSENAIIQFFRKLADILRMLFRSRDQLAYLFRRIDKGKFSNSQVVDNRFTREIGDLNPTELHKIAYDVDYTTDVKGNTIELKKYLSESDTNKIVGGVVNTFLRRAEGLDRYNKRELLEKILDDYQKLYLSKVYTGLTAEKIDRLEIFKTVLSEPEPREALIQSADTFLTLLGFNQDLESEEFDHVTDDLGDRRSTDHWNETHSFGGFKSLSGYVRKYIQSTSFEAADEFGNQYLNEETGERLQVGVNAGVVYNGLLKVSAGVTSAEKFIKRLLVYTTENPECGAFVNKFMEDTGLVFNETDGTYTAHKDPRLFNAIFKSFTLFQVDYMTLRVHPGIGMDIKLANRRDAAASQYNRWQNAFVFTYQDQVTGQPELKEKLQKALRSLYIPFQITNSISDEELGVFSDQNLTELQRLTGIKISRNYYKFSVVKYLSEKGIIITPAQQELLYSFSEVEPVTADDVAELSRTIAAGENPFVNFDVLPDDPSSPKAVQGEGDITPEEEDLAEVKKGEDEIKASLGKGNETRLRKIAKNNAIFDETVLATSWTNAEGKSVWSHQLPTFHLAFLEEYIKDPEKLQALIAGDSYLQGTYFGKQIKEANPSSRFMAVLKNVTIKRVDGMRQITGTLTQDGRLVENRRLEYNKREGLTFGDFKDREMILALIGLFMEPEHIATNIPERKDSTNRVRKVTTSRHLIRVLEASNTGDTINLPVINAIHLSGDRVRLSEEARTAFLTALENEFDRIRRVAKSIEDDKSGREAMKDIIADYNDYTNEKSKLKGLKFWNFSNLLGDLAAELETAAQLKYNKPISEQQKKVAIERIEASLLGDESGDLGGMTGEFLDLMVEAGVISKTGKGKYKNEMLPPLFFGSRKRTPERLNGLHLRNNFQANVAQFFINDFINTLSINELLLGDQSMSLKDFIDAVKRAKGANAAGYNLRSDITAPQLGIHERFDKSYIHVHKDEEYIGTYSGQKQKRTDGQMWSTIKAHRYIDFALGRLTSQSAQFIDRIELGLPVPANAIFGPDGSIKNNYQVSVKKVVHYNRDKYIKTSMFVLTKRMTSYMKPEIKKEVDELLEASGNTITDKIRELCSNNDNWLPWPGMEVLHNKRVMLEKWEKENNRVAFSAPESAVKLMRTNVGKDLINFSDGGFMELDNSFWRLQAENPSNKLSIIDPTQARQIIDSEQNDGTTVWYRGNQITVGELRELYQKDSARRIFLKYRDARNQIFSIEELEEELSTSIELGKVTPKLAAFQQLALESLQKTGATSQLLELFALIKDPDTGELTPKYDLNHPLTLNKYIQLFLAYFRSDVMSEKVPGHALTLVSDFGVKMLKRVKRVNKQNKPVEWEVIPRYIFERNPGAYTAMKDLEKDDFSPGDLFLDDLRYHVPEYDGQGNITGYYSEFIMPAHFKELLELGEEGIPEAIQKAFGVRIPSQDKSFFSSLKLVDFMPAELGSASIVPKEVIELAGEDFDVDKKNAQISDFFITTHRTESGELIRHEFTRYGDNAPTIRQKYEQYHIWNRENNKFLKKTLQQLLSSDKQMNNLEEQFSRLKSNKRLLNAGFEKGEPLSMDKLQERKQIDEKLGTLHKKMRDRQEQLEVQALLDCGLATTVVEFEQRLIDEGELNIGVLNNRLLDSKIQLLTNEFQQKNGLLHQAGNLQPIEDIEQDSRVKPGIIEEKNIDIDNPLGKVKAFGNNKEGQSNIPPAVNSMLTFTFLNKYGIRFRKDIDVYKVKLNGHEFEGYHNTRSAQFDQEGNFKGYTGSRIFTVISAIVTAMTDNAKERKAAKLNLNIDAVGIVSNLVSQGFPKEEAIAWILSPAVKAYYKRVRSQKYAIRTGKTKSSRDIMREMLEEYKQKVGGKEVNPSELTSKMLFDNLKPGQENMLASYSTLLHFSRVIEQTQYFSDVSQILKLSKGLGTELEEWDENIKRKAERLGLFDDDSSFKKRDVPFDIRDAAWNKHHMTSMYLKIALQLEELSKSMIIIRSRLFQKVKTAILQNLNVPGYMQKRINHQLNNTLILFFGLKGYLYQLTKRGDDLTQLLDNRLIYDNNDEYRNITQIVHEGKKLSPDNYLLNFLYTNPTTLIQKGEVLDNPGNRKGINTIEANTWAKLDAYQLDKLQNAFIDLYSNQDTRQVALALFAYTIVKDGTQFRSDSLIQFIPTFMLDELLGEIMVNVRTIFKRDNLQKLIENNADYAGKFREVFGTDFKGLVEEFYKTYLPHVTNNFYIPRVVVGTTTETGSANPVRFAHSGTQIDRQVITIDLFDQVRQKMWVQVASEEGITWEEAMRKHGKLNEKELQRFYKNKEALQKKGFDLKKSDGKWLVRLPYIIKVKNDQQGYDYYQLENTHDLKTDHSHEPVPLRDSLHNDDFTIWASKASYIKTSLIGVSAQTPLAKLFGAVPSTKIKHTRAFGYNIQQLSGGRNHTVDTGKDIEEMAVLAGLISMDDYNRFKSGKLPVKTSSTANDDFAGYTPDFFGIPAAEEGTPQPGAAIHKGNEISTKDLLAEKGYSFSATAGGFKYTHQGLVVQYDGTPQELLSDLNHGKIPGSSSPKKKTGLLAKVDLNKLREGEKYIPDEEDTRNPLNCGRK